MKYLACGYICVNSFQLPGQKNSDLYIGGPSIYALSGIKVWTDDVKLVASAGEDFDEYFGEWMRRNNCTDSSVKRKLENTTVIHMQYEEDGRYEVSFRYGQEQLGYLRTSPEDIERAVDGDTVGAYVKMDQDAAYWRGIERVKNRFGIKVMWEITMYNDDRIPRDKIIYPCSVCDCFSVNASEASSIFGIPKENENDIINELIKLKVPYILFRVGAKGSYSIKDGDAVFIPSVFSDLSVDPTGCGNSSTGSALFSFCEGMDNFSIGAMANIAAGFNAMSSGIIETHDETLRKSACEQLKKMRRERK